MGIAIAATPRKATCNSAASVTAGSQYFASVIAVVNKGRILFIIGFFVILILVPDYFAVFGVSTTYNSANIFSSGYCASVNTFSDGCSQLISANTTCPTPKTLAVFKHPVIEVVSSTFSRLMYTIQPAMPPA